MTRRARGTGSIITRRRDGKVIGYVARYKGHDRAARTKAAAAAALDALRVAVDTPPPPPAPPSPTLAAFAADFLRDVATRVRPETVRRYRHSFAMFLPALGEIPLAQLTPAGIQAAITQLVANGYAPGTVRVARRNLGTALAVAEDFALVPRNPAARTRPPTADERDVPALTVDAARAILTAVADTRLQLPVALGLLYGLRVAEVAAVRWEHVDRERIAVVGQLNRQRELVPTKSRRSTRTLPLVPQVADALERHRVRQLEDRLRAGPRWVDSGYAITQADGRPYHPHSLYCAWRRLQDAKGLTPRRTFHELRHGSTTLLMDLGVPERVAMEITGHASTAVHRRYQHVSPDAIEGALTTVSRALGG